MNAPARQRLRRVPMRALLALILAAAAGAAAPAAPPGETSAAAAPPASSTAARSVPAPAPEARTIIGLAAARPGERVRFTEERFSELLAAPMVLDGYVAMTDDGTLLRVVEQPFEERASIDGEQATLSRNGAVRRVNLDRRGAGGAYLRSLYALLTGDARDLEQRFVLEVSGDREQWQLTLTPREKSLERVLERIVVSGSGEQVERIRMERDGGAWQDMRLYRDAR